MNEAQSLFDELIIDVFGGGDPARNWQSYRDGKERSADALCSLVWNSTAPTPQLICDLAGYQAATYGELAQTIRSWFTQYDERHNPKHAYDRNRARH